MEAKGGAGWAVGAAVQAPSGGSEGLEGESAVAKAAALAESGALAAGWRRSVRTESAGLRQCTSLAGTR